MSLIKKSNELVIPTTVKMMIYGQAGMGKSTVALSAPKPLLLDFDNGVKRMNMAHLENIDRSLHGAMFSKFFKRTCPLIRPL